jgi:outer membrane protein OmpA-like peptidoglycan-associated protein
MPRPTSTRRVSAVVVAILALPALAGCDHPPEPPTTTTVPSSKCPATDAAPDAPVIAVVVGASETERVPALDLQRLQAFGRLLDNGFDRDAHLIVEFIGAGGIAINEGLVGEGPNKLLRDVNRNCRRSRLEAEFDATPTTGEPVDILGALVRLAQHLRALDSPPSVEVVVLSDLRNQAPPLDLTDPAAANQDAGAVLADLKGRGLVADCDSSWRWYLAGGGRTAHGDADSLNTSMLRRFWVEYVYRCGATPMLYDTELTFPVTGDPVPHPPDTGRTTRVERRGTVLELTLGSDGVLFDSGSHELRVGSEAALTDALEQLDRFSGAITVEGHTDDVGTANLALSQRRSLTVGGWLIAHGVSAERIDLKGFGDTQPIADNATDDGRRLNRRVVITVETAV